MSPWAAVAAALFVVSCGLEPEPVVWPEPTVWFGSVDPPESSAPPVLRRLTTVQFSNAVESLTGNAVAELAVADGRIGGFASNTRSPATAVTVDGIMRAAERAGAGFEPQRYVGCDLSAFSCRSTLTRRVLSEGFRRPPTDAEMIRYVPLAETPDLLVSAVIQSPHFLYLVEVGEPSDGPTRRLTEYELAARLSFALWDAPPDKVLRAEAAAGRLSHPGVLEAQARRMMADARFRPVFGRFIAQWFAVDELPLRLKSPTLYPDFGSARLTAMLDDFTGLAATIVLDEAGTLDRLLFGDHRAGLLTRPAWLAAHAHSDVTSPTRRGRFIRERLLCQTVPPPPGELAVGPLQHDPDSSPREQLTQHATDEDCSGCHRLMDPLGFGFEHYDAAGQWREAYANGAVPDVTGSLVLDGREQSFESGRALARWLAASPTVQRCTARQWFRFGLGRMDTAEDEASLDAMVRALAQGDGELRELLVALVVTDAFRFRRSPEGVVP